MTQYKAFAAGVEVNGETVLSVIDGMEKDRESAFKILADNGISDPRPGLWYPQQAWLDAFQEIAGRLGPDMLYRIGRRIPGNAKFPPRITTIEQALSSLDAAYHVNHRGGGIGSYRFIKTGERSGKLVCKNPYPCDFDRGLVAALADRFKPEESAGVTVRHDDAASCRKKGADSCTYLVDW